MQTLKRGWRKLYLEAIRALPDKWVDNETRIATYDDSRVVAGNPKYAPMVYKKRKKKWEKIKV